jgi:hypothetical protein
MQIEKRQDKTRLLKGLVIPLMQIEKRQNKTSSLRSFFWQQQEGFWCKKLNTQGKKKILACSGKANWNEGGKGKEKKACKTQRALHP